MLPTLSKSVDHQEPQQNQLTNIHVARIVYNIIITFFAYVMSNNNFIIILVMCV